MTEAFTRLLREVGDDVAPPPPPATAVLERGHHLRRRRTALLTAGTSFALVAVLTAAFLLPGAGGDRAVDPVAPVAPVDPPTEPTFEGVTYAAGNVVYLDGGELAVQIDDQAVKSLYYTSAGVLVRHGDDASSDSAGPQRFTLIRTDPEDGPNGTVSPVSVETEGNAHGADPTQPYLAWTEVVEGGVEVVVHDVDTDTEVARVPVRGEFEWSPPPVSLEGDTVYVGGRPGDGARLLAVDWRTGDVTESDQVAFFPEVTGGRTVDYDSPATVVEVADGSTVYTAGSRDGELSLSPSGRLVRETTPDRRTYEAIGTTVTDLDTGEEVDMPPAYGGWSTAGLPFSITGDELTVCAPASGECLTREIELPEPEAPPASECPDTGPCELVGVPVGPDVRYGGVLYES